MSNPILSAQIALSGEGLRSRVASAEKRAGLGSKPKKKKKTQPPPRTPNLIKPKQKFVDAQHQLELDARAADEALIKARGLRR